ncbi:hypothetical protein WISP_143109 [Willisornis vidua]|uniref:Uncharacterized protein n=1 Tax=Willisornis vidua TaxID=1566151 RepID=A0ABQ9CR19_9PASS|nr:hypothetical protein WISP_143109 [Willisornis vidua]
MAGCVACQAHGLCHSVPGPGRAGGLCHAMPCQGQAMLVGSAMPCQGQAMLVGSAMPCQSQAVLLDSAVLCQGQAVLVGSAVPCQVQAVLGPGPVGVSAAEPELPPGDVCGASSMSHPTLRLQPHLERAVPRAWHARIQTRGQTLLAPPALVLVLCSWCAEPRAREVEAATTSADHLQGARAAAYPILG